MWMRLIRDYSTNNKDSIALSFGIRTILKGCPVMMRKIDEQGMPEFFIYYSFGQRWIPISSLTRDDLDYFDQPGQCQKDGKDVFCPNEEEFFHVNGLAEKARFCPGCGKPLVPAAEFPCQEMESYPDRYFVRH